MTSPQQLRAQAAEHFAAQRFAEAGAVYGALLTRAPQDFEALHKLGIIRLETGGHAEGLELIATALTIDPTMPRRGCITAWRCRIWAVPRKLPRNIGWRFR